MEPEELAAAGLQYAEDGAVATITLDRPDVRNAQTPRMWHALDALGGEISDDVRVVVVKGNGPSFSAGIDLSVLDPNTPDPEGLAVAMTAPDQEIIDKIDGYQRGFTFLRDPRFISVAAVHGHAIGAGFQLALSCDLRVAAEDASFCMKEPALGLVPDLTGTKPLVECVGYARALEICATARKVGAAEAVAIGLVNQVVPADQLDSTVADLATALTATFAGAVRETKSLLQEATSRSLDEQRLAERTAQVSRFRELAKLMG